MKIFPKNKGAFCWQIKMSGGPQQAANYANSLGLDYLMVKVSDGTTDYNKRPVTVAGVTVWLDDIIQPLVDLLDQYGILAIAWCYTYLNDPVAEAKKFAQRIHKFGFKGAVVNAEKESLAKYASAALFMNTLKSELEGYGMGDIFIGVSSYRRPTYFPTWPWKEFLSKADAYMPQVYWIGAHNPVYDLNKSLDELDVKFSAIGIDIPIIPTGAAFNEHDWQPTVADLRDFHEEVLNLVKAGRLYKSDNWWELSFIVRLSGFFDEIKSQSFEETPQPQPEPEPEPTMKDVYKVTNSLGLNIRSSDVYIADNSNVVGSVSYNTKVIVEEIRTHTNGDKWARIGENLWIAIVFSKKQYCVQVPSTGQIYCIQV